MGKLQPVRGTRDLLPDEARTYAYIAETSRELAGRFGYLPFDTPIFEFSEVFTRTLGETSDIVTKEMYTFEDRGGDSLTLRPEGTAGVARAVISDGLQHELPLKLFYAGPMFRYERPQKGRLRQFHQIGVELIGVPEPLGDVEVIAMGAQILEKLGVLDRTTLELNTLGDVESRREYREALMAYLRAHEDGLSEDSRERLGRNPLRILDSKHPGDQAVIAEAPVFTDHLTAEAAGFFDDVRRGLDDLGIRYALAPRLVRGLDYYVHTAFEFTSTKLGAQGTVLAGGRYDGLIEVMGGPATPGVGWAGGIERLAMLARGVPEPTRPVALVPVGADAERLAVRLAHELRAHGFTVDLGYRGNLTRRLKRANKLKARVAVLLGEDELRQDAATLRDLDSGEQVVVPMAELEDRLAPFR